MSELRENVLKFEQEFDFNTFIKEGYYNNKFNFCNYIVALGCDNCEYRVLCRNLENPEILKEISNICPELIEYLIWVKRKYIKA